MISCYIRGTHYCNAIVLKRTSGIENGGNPMQLWGDEVVVICVVYECIRALVHACTYFEVAMLILS